VWTLRGDIPRLISAWKANQPQRRTYEQQFWSYFQTIRRNGFQLG
jgi:hypothetical protein